MDAAAIRWTPTNASAQWGNVPILELYACAYNPGEVFGTDLFSASTGKMTNHWVILCCVSDTNVIEFDPSTMGLQSRLLIELTVKDRVVTNQTAHIEKLDLTTTTAFTTNDILTLIVDAKYDKYQFRNGQGCRHWIHCVIELLNKHGILKDQAQVDNAAKALRLVWGKDRRVAPESEQTPIVAGRFFERQK